MGEGVKLKRVVLKAFLFLCVFAAQNRAYGVADYTKNVLILGDSHMYGDFGKNLHSKMFEKYGGAVTTIAVCPATPWTYLQEKVKGVCGVKIRKARGGKNLGTTFKRVKSSLRPLDELLSQLRPSLVVVALGTNLGRTSQKKIMAQVRGLTAKIRGKRPHARIVWMGPPNYKGADKIAFALAKANKETSDASYLDGRHFNLKRPLPRKNPHFGRKTAGKWALYMFDKMDHLFKMDTKRFLAAKPYKGPKLYTVWPKAKDSGCARKIAGARIADISYVGLKKTSGRGRLRLELKRTMLACKNL